MIVGMVQNVREMKSIEHQNRVVVAKIAQLLIGLIFGCASMVFVLENF
jgi:hypothetical protein